jgi:hypothetical protein
MLDVMSERHHQAQRVAVLGQRRLADAEHGRPAA